MHIATRLLSPEVVIIDKGGFKEEKYTFLGKKIVHEQTSQETVLVWCPFDEQLSPQYANKTPF